MPVANLRRIRQQRGYALRPLSKVLGCSHEAVRLWETRGITPHKRHHAMLEAVLGQPLSVLLAEDVKSGADQGSTPPESPARPAKDAQKVFVTHDEV